MLVSSPSEGAILANLSISEKSQERVSLIAISLDNRKEPKKQLQISIYSVDTMRYDTINLRIL